MNLPVDLASSRPLGVAEELGSSAASRADAINKRVVLTGSVAALRTQNGQWCFLDSLRLLSRVVGHLHVALPPEVGAFRTQVEGLASSVWSHGTVTVSERIDDERFEEATAVLGVGSDVHPQLPWTAINSNGWVARVSSDATPLPLAMEQSNPIAALMAASLGVAEVFKRIYGIAADRAPLLGATQFSLYDLARATDDPGPPLPTQIELCDTVLSGAGAIGNGVVLLLSQLPVRGHVHIVDAQGFAKENFETCVLLDNKSCIGVSKAATLAGWLQRDSLRCTAEQATLASAISGANIRNMDVDLVLNALDNIAARHDAQALWPAILVDGGINSIGAAVTTHRLDKPAGACMMCAFPLPTNVDPRALQRDSTGLALTSLTGQLDRPLTEVDIEQATPEKQNWLREQRAAGKTICSVVSESQLKQLGISTTKGFLPSAPFVATASAALVVAQALKSVLDPAHAWIHQYQLGSLFLGLESALAVMHQSSPNCRCMAHRDDIVAISTRRRERTQKG